MAITSRLGLHKPETSGEIFGDYFPDAYAADLQQIDDVVQIKDVAAAGNIPVYGVDGLLADSGIAPADLEAGLISSILTDQGMLLYKAADALAALSPDVAGKSLLTQGAGTNPVFGYPSHSTLTNLGIGDPHTQYVLRSLLSARGDLVYRDAAGWQRLPKGVSGTVLMQGANDPYWSMPKLDDLTVPDDNTDLNASTSKHGLMQKYPNTAQALKGDGSWITRNFEIDFPFGNGSDVIDPAVAEFGMPTEGRIWHVDLWEVGLISSSATCTLYEHAVGAAKGSAIQSFALSSETFHGFVTNITVTKGNILRAEVSNVTAAKQIVLRLWFEGT